MSDNIKFKVYITREDDPIETRAEVRRFNLKTESATFPKLREKLATLIPGVSSSLLDISWIDSDGDDVIVSSTEELRVAVDHMRDKDTCKLDIFIRSSNPGDSDGHRTESAKTNRIIELHFHF